MEFSANSKPQRASEDMFELNENGTRNYARLVDKSKQFVDIFFVHKEGDIQLHHMTDVSSNFFIDDETTLLFDIVKFHDDDVYPIQYGDCLMFNNGFYRNLTRTTIYCKPEIIEYDDNDSLPSKSEPLIINY